MTNKILLFIMLFITAFSFNVKAQWIDNTSTENQSTINQTLTPLEQVLNSDGTINLNSDITGSFDVSGYQMSYDQNGAPVFAPTVGSSKLAGDEKWSNEFP